MKFKLILLGLLVLGTGATVNAQEEHDEAAHEVSITVESIDEVSLSGGDASNGVAIVLDAADYDDGEELLIGDDTSTSVSWTTNGSSRRLTVESDKSTSFAVFTVEAVNCDTSAGATMSNTGETAITSGSAANLVTSISNQAGGCELTYRVEADLSTTGTETHSVTYTLVSE